MKETPMCSTHNHDHDHGDAQGHGHCGHCNPAEQATLEELQGRRDELDRQIAELESNNDGSRFARGT
jgi:cell division protein FtsB